MRLNGVLLEETSKNDELFSEKVWEGQFPPEHTFNLYVPMDALVAKNTMEITLNPADIEIFGVGASPVLGQPDINK